MKNILISVLAIITIAISYLYFVKGPNAILGSPGECKSPVAIYEDPTRIPLRSFILEEMGDLSGKRVADIGAGPGFFAFEMSKDAESVIATELDPVFLNYMKDKKWAGEYDNFEVLEGKPDHSELTDLKMDVALMVFVFHYLDDPKIFLDRLKNGMNPSGEVFIANAQMSSVIIQDYLSQAGFELNGIRHFSYTQPGGCGDLDVELVHAALPDDIVQINDR